LGFESFPIRGNPTWLSKVGLPSADKPACWSATKERLKHF